MVYNRHRASRVPLLFSLLVFAIIGLLPVAGALGGTVNHASIPTLRYGDTNHLDIGIGTPIQNGAFLTSDHRFLVFVGYLSFGGIYTDISNNSEVYAGALVLVIYSLVNSNQNLIISLSERGTTANQTTTVSPGVADVVTINLEPNNSWTSAKLVIDNTEQFYTVAVPVSLLPSYLDNIGGIDLIALGILSESLIALALALAAAYAAQRRAIFAPKFSLLVWGHVILIGIASAVIVDFQWVDQTFAGWSPLVYALFLWPIFFTFSLSYFNKAPRAELLQANTPSAGRLSFNRWTLRIVRTIKGWELIGPKWKHWFARLASEKNGHVYLSVREADLTKPDSSLPEPFIADIINRRVRSSEEILRRVRRPSPDKTHPLDDFDIISGTLEGPPKAGDDPPVKLLFTPTGFPVEVSWPKLSLHKDEIVPARTLPDGRIIAEHMRRHWSMPHYIPGKATLTLHSLHFRAPASVINGWRSVEDLGVLLDTVTLDIEALKSSFNTQVTKKVRERILAREALLGRGVEELDPLEAAEEAVREKTQGMVSLDQLFGRGLVPEQIASKAPDKIRRKRTS
jgi:hypothetical protein